MTIVLSDGEGVEEDDDVTTPAALFPDVEAHVLDWLKARLEVLADGPITDEHVGTETPADLQARLPFVRVERIGGNATHLEDYPRVEVEVFDSTRAGAYALAEAIRSLLLSPLSRRVGSRIDNVDTEIAPRRLPWEAAGTVRFSAEYSLSFRRR